MHNQVTKTWILTLFILILLCSFSFAKQKTKQKTKKQTKQEKSDALLLKELEKDGGFEMIDTYKLLSEGKIFHNPERKKFNVQIGGGMTFKAYDLSPSGANSGFSFSSNSATVLISVDSIITKIPIRRTYFGMDISYLRSELFFDLVYNDTVLGGIHGSHDRISFNIKSRYYFTYKLNSPYIDVKVGFRTAMFDSNANDKIAASSNPEYKDLIVDHTYFAPTTGLNFNVPLYRIKFMSFGILGSFDYLIITKIMEDPNYATGRSPSVFAFSYCAGAYWKIYKELALNIFFQDDYYRVKFQGSPISDISIRTGVTDPKTTDRYQTVYATVSYGF